MGKRIRNVNKGITRIPEAFDIFDIMHETFQKTINGTTLLPGIYKGKVINVRRILDPNSVHMYEVLAWIPEVNTSTDEPEIYTDLSPEDLNGLKYYKPISDDVEEPCIGMAVNIFIEDPSSAIGYYHSISSHEFDIRGDRYFGENKIGTNNSPRKSIEEGK